MDYVKLWQSLVPMWCLYNCPQNRPRARLMWHFALKSTLTTVTGRRREGWKEVHHLPL